MYNRMKYVVCFVLVLMMGHAPGFAQFTTTTALKSDNKSPVSWHFEIKKTSNGDYRLEAMAIMAQGFHVWAQDPGGDGSLIPTSFTAEQIPNGKWIGDWKEVESPKTQTLEFVEGAVRWHEKSVTFYREFKAPKGSKIKGSVQFQTCNDQICLPPAIQNFSVLVE